MVGVSEESTAESSQCALCSAPAKHKHAITGELACCGHASNDIDAKPIEDGHECETYRTIEQHTRSSKLECEHRDNPNPPTGDLVPCHEDAEWEITTSHFPGEPTDPEHPGAPTKTRYCDEHFLRRLREVL